MARKLINLRLPEDLLARVDLAAEVAGQTRTKFVERALEKALGGSEESVSKEATVVVVPASSRAAEKSGRPSLADTWRR